jgi:subtilisin family serine protease
MRLRPPRSPLAVACALALAVVASPGLAAGADGDAVGDQTYLATIDRPASLPALAPVKVAVLDAGIDALHPDLAGRVVGARRFGAGDPLYPGSPHGTATAGLIAAIDGNGIGIDGIAPNALLLSAEVTSRDDPGGFDDSAVERAIRWAADSGARVINLSLAGVGPDPGYEAAVDYAVARGALVVAAAGNCFDEAFARCTPAGSTQSPAWLPHVVAVGATNDDTAQPAPAAFSIPSARWVDLAAPGELITTLWPTRNNPYPDMPGCLAVGTTACYATGDASGGPWGPSGTSYAAPMVSAAAAILFGARPDLQPGQVASLLDQTARPLPSDPLHQAGAGELDIAAALARLDAGDLPPRDYREPNDEPATAAPLPPSGEVRATLDWQDDPVDVYRVRLARGTRVAVDASAGLHVTVRLSHAGRGNRYWVVVAADPGQRGSYTLRVGRR